MMGKIVPIAFIPESATANWIDSTVANKDVRDALEEFVAELEWGKCAQQTGHRRLVGRKVVNPKPEPTNDVHPAMRELRSIIRNVTFHEFSARLCCLKFDFAARSVAVFAC